MTHFQKILEYTKTKKFVIDNTKLIPDYKLNEIKTNMIFIITCIKNLQAFTNNSHQKLEQESIISLLTNILYSTYEIFDLNGINADNKLCYDFYLKEDRVKNILQSTNQLDDTYYELNDSELLDLLKKIRYNVDYAIQTLVPEPKLSTRVILSKEDELVEERMTLIFSFVEEINEFKSKWNSTEICEILSNLIYVIYDTFTLFNIDVDMAFNILHNSNLTKLCDSEDDAIKSVKYYIHTNEYCDPQYMKIEHTDFYIIYNKSTNKILKSISYTVADFSTLLQ